MNNFKQIKTFIISLVLFFTIVVYGTPNGRQHHSRLTINGVEVDIEIFNIDIGFSATRPPDAGKIHALVERMLKSAIAGRLILRTIRRSFQRYGAANDQNVSLEAFNLMQVVLMNLALDLNEEQKKRAMALQFLKEFDLSLENINLLNAMSENKQEHRKLRRLAKRLIKLHSKSSRCERALS